MPLEIALPMLGKKKTVKDHIISILSYEWPLTLKKLYNILRKKYQLEVSYQACRMFRKTEYYFRKNETFISMFCI